MKNKIIIILLFTAFFILSCTKNSTPTTPAETDEEAIRNLIYNNYSTLLTETSHYGEEDTTNNKGNISPLYWYRHLINAPQRDIIVSIDDTIALVTISFIGSGNLKIFYYEDSIIHFTKNFSDNFSREVMFRRVGSVNDTYRGWILIGIKPAKIITTGANVFIDSVSIQTSDTTYLLDQNVLEGYQMVDSGLSDLMKLEKNDTISMIYYTHGDSVDAFFHLSWSDYHRRIFLTSLGNNIYSRDNIVLENTMPERINIALDIIDFRTLNTTEDPYYANAFIIPFRTE